MTAEEIVLSETTSLTNLQILTQIFNYPGEEINLNDLINREIETDKSESFSLNDLKTLLIDKVNQESFSFTDVKSFSINKNIQEILNLSDGDFRNIIKILNESIGTTAEVLRQFEKDLILSEGIELTSKQILTQIFNYPGEEINLLDSKIFSIIKSLTEVTNLLDEYSKIWSLDREYTESLSLSDEVLKSIFRSLSDSLNLLDNFSKTWGANKELTETINLDVERISELLRNLAESFNLVDYYSRTWDITRTLNELFSITDGDSIAFTRILREAFGLSDETLKTIMRELIESYSLSDDLLAEKWILKLLTETMSTSDNYSKVWDLAREYSETINLNASAVKATSRMLVDTFNLSENLIKAFTRILSESQTLNVSLTKQTIRNLSEGLSLTDGDIKSIIKNLVEGLNLSDNFSRDWISARTFTEIMNLSDDLNAMRTAFKELIESFNLDDGTMSFNFIKLLMEEFSFDDFFVNLIFDSFKVASARADIQSIITIEGIEATLIRQTETTDTTGAVTAVSEQSYAIYVSIQDIIREDRQLRDMGSAFPGEAKIFLFHEYPDSITGNGIVSAQVGDMIKDDEDKYWRIETIKAEHEMDGSEIFKSAIMKRVDLEQ